MVRAACGDVSECAAYTAELCYLIMASGVTSFWQCDTSSPVLTPVLAAALASALAVELADEICSAGLGANYYCGAIMYIEED